jgi:hypothetical protein
MTRALAADLARALADEGPCSGSDLARRVGARKAAVLRELRLNERFVQVGQGPHSTWNLLNADVLLGASNRRGTGWEPTGGDATAEQVQTFSRQVAELQRRVGALAVDMAEVQQHVGALERSLARRTGTHA